MLVKVYMSGSLPAVMFSDADNVDITSTGALRISSSGSKDRPLMNQIGGVASGLWTYYQVLSDASVVGDSNNPVDTNNEGEVTPS